MLKERLPLLDPAIFRSYDIRGVVGESLTEETIFFIGKAIGSMLRERGENQLALGRDGRISSPILQQALCAGLLSTGCDVVDIGMVPTPLLYFATNLFDQHSGVMLTGSHNPSNYNGVKMVIQGKSPSEEAIKALYHRILEQQFVSGQGVRKEADVESYYLETVRENIHLAKPLKVVVDAGNGATGNIAPKLYRELGCDVHELYCEVDGRFPNHHPDPSQDANLQDLISKVKEVNADIGLAFDGDGDRLGVVTRHGEIISADRLMILFSKAIIAEQAGAKIIFDVKCSDHLAETIKSHGGEAIMWKTGHSLIKAKLAETKAQLAGEMSGHLFFNDRWYGFDDALYAGARLLEILADAGEECDKLFASLPVSCITPELKIMVPEDDKFFLMHQLMEKAHFPTASNVNDIDGLRVAFSDGWGLIRPSNTTPCLVMRFEAVNAAALTEIQTIFKEWLLSVRPELALPF